MQKPRRELPIDYLRECFLYNPISGELRWKERPRHHFAADRDWRAANTLKAGRLVSAKMGGRYATVDISGVKLLVHRVCYAIHHGYWPPVDVDHENRDITDNRADNLRPATEIENGWNIQKPVGRSGFRGVSFLGEKSSDGYPLSRPWVARIRVGKGKRISLGCYETAEEAYIAYCDAADEYHGKFASYDPP